MARSPNDESRDPYWDEVGRQWSERGRDLLWRRSSDAIHERWLNRAAAGVRGQLVLKTDLFDEAFGDGLAGWFERHGNSVFACDIAFSTARKAQRQKPLTRIVVADVRRLPLAGGVVDCVVSDSTLDHFDSEQEISKSLAELARVLKPGGLLLLTMDNPQHPLLWFRNKMPRLWIRLGVVPYQVGVTCGARRLRELLRDAGFEVVETRGLMHTPRVLMVLLCGWLQRKRAMTAPSAGLLRLIEAFERLERFPADLFTGHFVAVTARKRI